MDGAGQQLAEIDVRSARGRASGWQEERLAAPGADHEGHDVRHVLLRDQRPIAFSPAACLSGDGTGPLVALADVANGGNGVFQYGPSAFPDQTLQRHELLGGRRLHAHTAGGHAPAARSSRVTPAVGAIGRRSNTKVTVTFDEPIDPADAQRGRARAQGAAGNALAGAVDLRRRDAEGDALPPPPRSQYGQTYTATVKSGNAGVTDLAGNQLTADVDWTFTYAAAVPLHGFLDHGAGGQHRTIKDQPIEVGIKFRPTEDGYITRLRFYKQCEQHRDPRRATCGQPRPLLATATFADETASGWQEVNAAEPDARRQGHDVRRLIILAQGYFGVRTREASRPLGVDRSHASPCRTSSGGRQRRIQVRRRRLPEPDLQRTNYWVDATFQRVIPPDTRGPT